MVEYDSDEFQRGIIGSSRYSTSFEYLFVWLICSLVPYLDLLVHVLAAVGVMFLLQLLWKICTGLQAKDRSGRSNNCSGRGSECLELFRSSEWRRE